MKYPPIIQLNQAALQDVIEQALHGRYPITIVYGFDQRYYRNLLVHDIDQRGFVAVDDHGVSYYEWEKTITAEPSPSGIEDGREYDAYCLECEGTKQRVAYRFGAWICPQHRDLCHVHFVERES